jgi:hypothetical protein
MLTSKFRERTVSFYLSSSFLHLSLLFHTQIVSQGLGNDRARLSHFHSFSLFLYTHSLGLCNNNAVSSNIMITVKNHFASALPVPHCVSEFDQCLHCVPVVRPPALPPSQPITA